MIFVTAFLVCFNILKALIV